jgi:hypothetical protein
LPNQITKLNCHMKLPNWIAKPNWSTKWNCQSELPNRIAKLNSQTELPNLYTKWNESHFQTVLANWIAKLIC